MTELFILTGPSGSGVTSAKFVFEELGYYIVDNAPSAVTEALLDSFADRKMNGKGLALIPPMMSARQVYEIAKKDERFETKLIVLDTKKDELIKRYALSRHDHPRAILSKISLEKAIELDCKNAEELGTFADIYIDTTNITSKDLRTTLYNRLENKEEFTSTKFTFMSFGFKHGAALGVDEIIDVRILPNPYWVSNLAALDGRDQPVIDYINSFPITHEYLDRLVNYLSLLMEQVQKDQRPSYTIGIACSGGQHRSTFVADYLTNYFKDKYNVRVFHRDSPDMNNEEK
ncbi:MAG: hypothetical protein K6F07_00775 [Bacilli bacterium]|nr:hypothetical protein [Bacilli bacterium]